MSFILLVFMEHLKDVREDDGLLAGAKSSLATS